MGYLEDLLRRNLDSETVDERCVDGIKSFLDSNDTPIDQGIDLTEIFLQVTNKIISSDDGRLSDSHLEKICLFNLEGLCLLEEGTADHLDENARSNIEFGLNRNLGNTVKTILERTSDPSVGESLYMKVMDLAQLSLKNMNPGIVYVYATAAEILVRMYTQTGNEELFKKFKDMNRKSVRFASRHGKLKHVADAHFLAARNIRRLVRSCDHTGFLWRVYESFIESGDIFFRIDKLKPAISSYNSALRFANNMFQRTRHLHWLEKAGNAAMLQAYANLCTDKKKYAGRMLIKAAMNFRKVFKLGKSYSFNYSGTRPHPNLLIEKLLQSVKNLYNTNMTYISLFKDELNNEELANSYYYTAINVTSFLENAYLQPNEPANIFWTFCKYNAEINCAQFNLKVEKHERSYRACANAGLTAYDLFYITGDSSWRDKAIDCYDDFLGYYGANPPPKMAELAREVRSKMRRLLELRFK